MTFPWVVTPYLPWRHRRAECLNRASIRNSPGFPLQPEADPFEALRQKEHAGIRTLAALLTIRRAELREIDPKHPKDIKNTVVNRLLLRESAKAVAVVVRSSKKLDTAP